MKAKLIMALILILGLYGASLGQSHQGHNPQVQRDAETKQDNKAPSRQLSDLIRDGENSLRAVKEAARNRNAESLDRAVILYISILTEINNAMRLTDTDGKDFDKDLARVEKMSRKNLETLEDLRKDASTSLVGSLEDATVATGETLIAATDLRDEIKAEGDDHNGHGQHGCCGHGSGTRDPEKKKERGWGPLLRRRGC